MKSILSLILITIFFLIIYSCGTESHIDTETTAVPDKTVKVVPIENSDTEGEAKNVSINTQKIKPIKGGPDDDKIQRVGFYNVENLFDTKNDPKKADEEFLPNGKNKWTNDRYQEKLDHLSKVIDHMGQPGIMGLCEVENKATLDALMKEPAIKDAKYVAVHQESPDFRGIDVALLYSKDEYKLIKKDFIRIDFPKSIVEDYTTRDILHATLQNNDKEYIHVFVCHWPSRRGGEKESEPKRVYVAQQVKKEIDKIFEEYDDNHIIVMGDLNDEPSNKSADQILGAKPVVNRPKSEQLYNLVYDLHKNGYGSYNYRGSWNMLDHIIVSGSLLDGKKTEVKNTKIFNRNFMLYYNKKDAEHKPNRTFSGGKYYGGYSDHLPVYSEIGK
jgi:predicted extracellular nuclease